MKFDIDGFSLRELDELLKTAERRKAVISKRRPAPVVRKELAAIAAKHGYTVSELFDLSSPDTAPPKKRTAKRKQSKVAAKYRDPDNKRNTWSGRGSQPRWLAEKVKRGKSATDYLLPGLARPTSKKNSPIGQKTVFKQA